MYYLVCMRNIIKEAYFFIGPILNTLSDTQIDSGIASVRKVLTLQYCQTNMS